MTILQTSITNCHIIYLLCWHETCFGISVLLLSPMALCLSQTQKEKLTCIYVTHTCLPIQIIDKEMFLWLCMKRGKCCLRRVSKKTARQQGSNLLFWTQPISMIQTTLLCECVYLEGRGKYLERAKEVKCQSEMCWVWKIEVDELIPKRNSTGSVVWIQCQQIKTELTAYLQSVGTDSESHPLEWWKGHEEMFPNLKYLVKNCICVHPSPIPHQKGYLVPVGI